MKSSILLVHKRYSLSPFTDVYLRVKSASLSHLSPEVEMVWACQMSYHKLIFTIDFLYHVSFII